MTTDPVTLWIDRLKSGDRAAVGPLWERYFGRLVALARGRLRATPRRMADEEDVALSAFDSFCRAAEEGRLERLIDRDSLWSHLFVYTLRKAHYLTKKEFAEKRGGGQVVAASDAAGGDAAMLDVLGREPTPEMAAMFEEHYRRLLQRLPSDELRSVAQWRLEGHTNDEIAAKLGCVRRSVERMVQLVRTLWEGEIGT